MAERAGLLGKLLLAGAAALLTLLAGEVVARVFLRDRCDTESLRAALPDLKLGRYRQRAADDLLYYEMKPNLDIRFGESVVRTDARGVRVSPSPAPDPPGKPLELVVLGDSTSFGWRVDYEQSYPALLAARLAAAWGRPVHLTNRSVPGYDSEQEEEQLRTLVLPAHPDLVIWHVDHNDAGVALESYQPVALRPEDGDNPLHSALLKLLLRARHQHGLEQRLLEQAPAERLGGYVVSGPLWERHVRALERGVAAAQQAGVPLLLAVFDCNVWFGDASQEHVTRLHEPLLARLAAAGAACIDLYPPLQSHAAQQGWTDLQPLWLAADDPHPSPAGHALVAGLLGDALLQRWPAPPEHR